jgi:hypothetical protein
MRVRNQRLWIIRSTPPHAGDPSDANSSSSSSDSSESDYPEDEQLKLLYLSEAHLQMWMARSQKLLLRPIDVIRNMSVHYQ